ncbi:hypothetical protein [Clostridium sp. HBUAS56010]|uniref:hypothetical protein n=1 Tax=Clostridium sp. HBUAS56010 TaxID=2571127 RepID=UPI0011783EE2|nr:hypothetical protein [Clostridium sp. HBUAS56010]
MGTKRIFSCDRCGKEWPEENNNGFVNYPRHVDYEDLKRIDLCKDCEKEFYKLVGGFMKKEDFPE